MVPDRQVPFLVREGLGPQCPHSNCAYGVWVFKYHDQKAGKSDFHIFFATVVQAAFDANFIWINNGKSLKINFTKIISSIQGRIFLDLIKHFFLLKLHL